MMLDNIYITKITNCCTGSVVFLTADTEYARECAQEAVLAVLDLMDIDDVQVESVEDYDL